MISPVGKKYYKESSDKVVKVIDYKRLDGVGNIKVIIYINLENGEMGRIPLKMFRKRYIRYNQYTQQKQKLKI